MNLNLAKLKALLWMSVNQGNTERTMQYLQEINDRKLVQL